MNNLAQLLWTESSVNGYNHIAKQIDLLIFSLKQSDMIISYIVAHWRVRVRVRVSGGANSN